MTRPSPAGGCSELIEVKRRLSKTTNRLQRHIQAIRNQEIPPPGFHYRQTPTEGLPDRETRVDSRRVGRLQTLDYPVQGKLQKPLGAGLLTRVGYAEWEPAESLYIAIIVGPDDLDSGGLRDQLRDQRRQRHDAMVYRWQGDFTLDVIGFDAIDHKSDRITGRVDLVLLSDRILGGAREQASVRELERIALQTRLQFRDSYIVGLIGDDSAAVGVNHAFHSVERKARSKGLTVFDQHLPREVDQDRVTRLLVSFAKSRRYAADRSVWLTPDLGDVPLPIPKEDISPGS